MQKIDFCPICTFQGIALAETWREVRTSKTGGRWEHWWCWPEDWNRETPGRPSSRTVGWMPAEVRAASPHSTEPPAARSAGSCLPMRPQPAPSQRKPTFELFEPMAVPLLRQHQGKTTKCHGRGEAAAGTRRDGAAPSRRPRETQERFGERFACMASGAKGGHMCEGMKLERTFWMEIGQSLPPGCFTS